MRAFVCLMVALGAFAAMGAGRANRGVSPDVAADDTQAKAAQEAVASNTLADFGTSLDAQVHAVLADLPSAKRPAYTQLAAYREFGRYFAAIKLLTDSQRQTLTWLAGQPRLLTPLLLAVTPDDDPARVLEVLEALRTSAAESIVSYPELAVAFCVVWDDLPGEPDLGERGTSVKNGPAPLNADALRRIWQHCTTNRARLQTDPTILPYQLARFVVDNPINSDELTWVLTRYRNRPFSGRIYQQVPYDVDAFYTGQSTRRGNRPYTLANVLRYGGVCRDQAYYAAHVAKTLGIPATICTGQGGTGRGVHAWTGFLQKKGRAAAWDFEEARYEEHLYWSGSVIDPQTHQALTDADVSLSAQLLETSAADRWASMALVKMCDTAPDESRAEVYMSAIDLSAGNRSAWMALADLGAAGKLSEPQSRRVVDVVSRFALKQYPDFAFAVCRRMVSGREPAVRLSALARMEQLFVQRPDLVAAAIVDRGDLLREQGRPEEALGAYTDVLTRNILAGPVVLTAIQRADALLREKNEIGRLAKLYEQVWPQLPEPEAGVFAVTTPYYKVGEQYARLMKDSGDQAKLREITERLDQLSAGK